MVKKFTTRVLALRLDKDSNEVIDRMLDDGYAINNLLRKLIKQWGKEKGYLPKREVRKKVVKV